MTYTRDEAQHGRWSCACGRYDVGKAETLVAHVIGSHSAFSQRPRMAAELGTGDFRLSGKHADPTYEQAIRHMTGHAW
ncbi:MAG: hypothetical protein H0X24_12270 [Ktedonobacterales bacterium]|nr:hypothetical protein [Ktedonobacterales bacterium]